MMLVILYIVRRFIADTLNSKFAASGIHMKLMLH
jgi:hypothetical protein